MAAGTACGTETGLLFRLGLEQERYSAQPQSRYPLIRLSAASG